MTDHSEAGQKPQVDALTNGEVRLVIDVSDPVTDLGIHSEPVSVESNGKVSDELAEHIWDEYRIAVHEHGIGVFER